MGASPHASGGLVLRALRLPDFRELARRDDPAGKFRNAYTDRYLFDAG